MEEEDMSYQDKYKSDEDGKVLAIVVRLPKPAEPASQSGATESHTRDVRSKSYATDLAAAMMCRLQIPQGPTIVGLLATHAGRTNFEELVRWISQQLPELEGSDRGSAVDKLCRRFVRAVDRSLWP
jgi:hypothetical protein